MATYKSYCLGNFSLCRKYEDDSITAIIGCSKTNAEFLLQAKALTDNSAAIAQALNTTASLASSNRFWSNAVEKITSLFGRNNNGAKPRAALTTCAAVISVNILIVTYVSQNPYSTTIATLALQVAISTSVTCTASEQSSLSTQVTSLKSAVQTIATVLAVVQINIQGEYMVFLVPCPLIFTYTVDQESRTTWHN